MATVAPTGAATRGARLADDLLSVVTRLSRRLRRIAPAGGVTPTQRSILNTLERRGALTHGELAAAEQVRPPTITAAVDRLEQDGLVARERDETDRRITRVHISAAGRDLLARTRRERTAELAQRIAALTPEERTALLAALPALTRLAEMDAP